MSSASVSYLRDGGMVAGSRELPPWLVPAHVRRHAVLRGARDAVVMLQDFDQQSLVPLTDESLGKAVSGGVGIDGTAAGRAFATMTTTREERDGATVLNLPLIDGGERIGLLAVTLPSTAPPSDWEEFAAIVAMMLVSKGQHTDVYYRARRRKDMSLAAEMQWHLLPPLSVVDPRVAISGCVEPAYNVGGDAFDYAVNLDMAHLAVFDAMGHGLDAAVMASVTVSAYRHGRRAETPVEDLYTMLDATFYNQFGGDRFVTAQLVNLHLPSGVLTVVNAGHLPPLHIRGDSVIGQVAGPTTLPIGLGGEHPEVIVATLEPGDRLLLYTDGVLEERRDGAAYGEEHFVADVEEVLRLHVPLPETVRQLNQRLKMWRDGDPADDASLLLAEWRTPDLPLP